MGIISFVRHTSMNIKIVDFAMSLLDNNCQKLRSLSLSASDLKSTFAS